MAYLTIRSAEAPGFSRGEEARSWLLLLAITIAIPLVEFSTVAIRDPRNPFGRSLDVETPTGTAEHPSVMNSGFLSSGDHGPDYISGTETKVLGLSGPVTKWKPKLVGSTHLPIAMTRSFY
jgi:hypothetical protein